MPFHLNSFHKENYMSRRKSDQHILQLKKEIKKIWSFVWTNFKSFHERYGYENAKFSSKNI